MYFYAAKVNTEGGHQSEEVGKRHEKRASGLRTEGGVKGPRGLLIGRLVGYHYGQEVKTCKQIGGLSPGQTLDSISHWKHLPPSSPPPHQSLALHSQNRAGASTGPEGIASRPAVLDLPSAHSRAGACSPWCIFKAAHVCYPLERKKRHVLCFSIACMMPLGSPSGFYDK